MHVVVITIENTFENSVKDLNERKKSVRAPWQSYHISKTPYTGPVWSGPCVFVFEGLSIKSVSMDIKMCYFVIGIWKCKLRINFDKSVILSIPFIRSSKWVDACVFLVFVCFVRIDYLHLEEINKINMSVVPAILICDKWIKYWKRKWRTEIHGVRKNAFDVIGMGRWKCGIHWMF